MKKVITISILAICALISSCGDKDTDIAGGDDKISKMTADIEAVRMVNIDGYLYYETDNDSELQARCGVMDGSFTKTVGELEIPKNHGEANFSNVQGYQIGMTENTIEIPIDDWEVFKKVDTKSDVLKYKYCYLVEGTLPNAKDDSEFLVLADSLDITFEDAAYKMFGSNSEKMKDIYVLPIVD